MTILVTGHSRGLGAALAAELLGRGYRVFGVSRGGNDDLAARFPDRFAQAAVDLGDPAAVQGWLTGGGLRAVLADGDDGAVALVNNAGTVAPVGPAGTLDAAEIARAVALNVTAPLLLADAFVAATEGRADRRVMHISSGAARSAYAGWSIYCATKAALDHHARAVIADARPGLRIASVAPGVIDTDMQAAIRATTPEQFTLRERFVALKESGSLSSPEDAARALADMLLAPRFGAAATADVRDAG